MPRRASRILLLGLGGVGLYLAKWLTQEGFSLTAIEADGARLSLADAELDARLIQGDALDLDTWEAVRGERFDYVIAVTSHDAANLAAAVLARRIGAKHIIARVRRLQLWRPDGLLPASELGIDLLIRPDELAAQEIARLLKMRSGGLEIEIDRSMRVLGAHLESSSALAGRALRQLTDDFAGLRFRVVAIARDARTLIPGGDEVLRAGDHLFVLTHANDQARCRRILGISRERAHRLMIVGGGLIGARVAELLQDTMPVRVLEADERRAEALTRRLPGVKVLHGDGSTAAVLKRAGVRGVDTVVTATGDDETNVLTAAMAKHLLQSARPAASPRGRTIALVRKEEYLVLASFLGSDIVLAPKVLAGNRVLQHIRRGKLLALAHLHGCDAEVLELVADRGAPITQKPLKELGDRMVGRAMIGAVHQGGDWRIATGDTHIQPGDKVIGICLHDELPALESLFER